MQIKIGIVDDHQLFVSSLKALIETNDQFKVELIAYGGVDLQAKIKNIKSIPDIILLDVNMPEISGSLTALWLKENYPDIKVAALSMNKDDSTVIRMLKSGCCAYLFKNINHDEFERALLEIYNKGYYNGDECNLKFRRLVMNDKFQANEILSEKEVTFLKHASSDLTYVQIADLMHCSKRTVDGYREILFQKFKVQSRVGLCLEAIRRGIVDL